MNSSTLSLSLYADSATSYNVVPIYHIKSAVFHQEYLICYSCMSLNPRQT